MSVGHIAVPWFFEARRGGELLLSGTNLPIELEREEEGKCEVAKKLVGFIG